MPLAIRITAALAALGVTAGGIIAGYRESSPPAAQPETQAHADAEHQRLDKRIDDVMQKLPSAVWAEYERIYGKKAKN